MKTPVRSSPKRQCTKILCPGLSWRRERNWTSCSSVGGDQELTGIWTKRMPKASARWRSQLVFSVFTAQVDDGVDAKDFQLREADFPWLRAAIENFGNFTGVGNAANMQFLAKGGLSEGWRGRLRNILRRSLRKEGERKSEKEGEGWKRAFHIDSDASSVA